jgi:hypothetical protein
VNPATPIAFALFGLALPVIAAYFHRRRRTPLRMPSAVLFRVIAGQTTPTSRAIAKPRHLLSLLLVLLALAGLVAALVDLQRDGEEPRSYVVVLDTSASMGAKEVGEDKTRLQRAVDELEAATGRLGPQDRMALITTGDQTTVRIGFTEDHPRLVEVARGLEADGTSQAAAGALRIADAMCKASKDASIILLSDGVGVDAPATTCAIEHVPVGRVGPNVGITGFSVREADALGLAEVYVAVTADRIEAGEVEVSLELDGQLIDVIPVDVPASGEAKRVHRIPMPPGKTVVARLSNIGEDVLSADDTASAPRRLGGRVRTILVSTSRLSFTAEALRLHPRVDLTVIGPHDALPDGAYDLLVLEAMRPASELPAAPKVLAFGPAAAELGLRERGTAELPEIVRWSFDDALFRFVSFDEVAVPDAAIFETADDVTSLVDSDKGALAVRTKLDDRTVVAFGFLPHESDFVLRVGFVNLMANVVEWAVPDLAGDTEEASIVMATTEARVNPATQIENTSRGDFSGPVRTTAPLWRTLSFVALGVLALEWLLPALAGFLGGWRERRLKARRRKLLPTTASGGSAPTA